MTRPPGDPHQVDPDPQSPDGGRADGNAAGSVGDLQRGVPVNGGAAAPAADAAGAREGSARRSTDARHLADAVLSAPSACKRMAHFFLKRGRTMNVHRNRSMLACLAATAALSGLLAGCQTAGTQGTRDPRQVEAHNMQLVGYHDLQARTAYQPVIHQQGDRWIAYIGHHGGAQVNPLTGNKENNGTSIVDVTDPKQPKYLAHIPGDAGEGEAGGAQMVRICDGKTLPQGRSGKRLHAAHLRQQGARDLGRDRSREAGAADDGRQGPARTRTRTGGNATPASPTSFRECRIGARRA